jgi:phosphatidate cytidylyltransferase
MDDVITLGLIGGVLASLAVATVVGHVLRRQADTGINRALVHQFNLRVRAWWLLLSTLAAAMLLGSAGYAATVILFFGISFWAMREYVTVTPTRLGDHRALFWVFVLFLPLQYVLVGMRLYELYSVMIPVYAFLFVPARVAFAGDFKRFLERTATVQAGLMVCVYCLSYAPALLTVLGDAPEERNRGIQLLFFFILMTQLGDALQYLFGRLWGQRVIAPSISASRTWEGFVGGMAATTLVGAALWWATPFGPLQAAALTLVITISGYAGGMTMSAIKRDRGVKDYGTLVEGHGGVLDRIDSICFAAPVFYHITRYLQLQDWLG